MSLDHPVLDQVVLGASSLFDAKRAPVAAHMTVFPQRPDAAIDAAGLLQVIDVIAPPEGGPLMLSVANEAGLRAVLHAPMAPHLMIEVPGFMLSDPELATTLQERVATGLSLVLGGRVPDSAPQHLWQLFRAVTVDRANIRNPLPAGLGGKPLLRYFVGADGPAMSAGALKAGFSAVVGWPVGDAPGADSKAKPIPAGVTTVVDLMQRVDRQEPAEKLEAVVKNDPTLAFRLMRYLNSPGFGLSVEISSFRHALMILGYQRLKRWLALLVTSAIDDPDLKPLMQLAVRRGLLMEEIARPSGDDALRNELFICGVFSTLDRMIGQPFEQLLKTIPVQESVAGALAHDTGPCAPFLALARAVETESAYDIRECAGALMLSVGDVNRALAKSLVHAHSLTKG
ncbi:EAL and HDOD domain-containing protein [Scleromatobacter humisilvae]|uniref:HDOD domain-containing protein n=1 Tax=Scleromatobacter humisilvae TaxID=2897159 RepID=A0A9X1YEM1_9BURK|nr:HDOD domain-containing protein [Scleromatobacter humisilvae]MCK9684593.1 HDOD domain-containing protein [Scleromatobacter humisilvae]